MTRADIEMELGWSNEMICSLLQGAYAVKTQQRIYTEAVYHRERVFAISQTAAAIAAKKAWDETLRGPAPEPGWTTRLGDIGQELDISAVAVGKILELLGYRVNKQATDRAIEAACGARRWDGYVMHYDWHLERVVSAIQATHFLAVPEALAVARARRKQKEQAKNRKHQQQQEDSVRRAEEKAVISELMQELQSLRSSDRAMTLIAAVEYATPDPGLRLALYRLCSPEDRRVRQEGQGQSEPRLAAEIASSIGRDFALLERRAKAEGFQV